MLAKLSAVERTGRRRTPVQDTHEIGFTKVKILKTKKRCSGRDPKSRLAKKRCSGRKGKKGVNTAGGSDFFHTQVTVEVEDGLAPVGGPRALGYVQQPLPHHLAYKVQRPTKVRIQKKEHLPFAGGQRLCVELTALQGTEERLDWCRRVAVRARVEYLKTEPAHDSHRIGARMVGCVVPEENCVFLPAWLFTVQGVDQLVKEEGDHVTIGGGVR